MDGLTKVVHWPNKKNTKEAIACFDTAIKIDPEDSQVFFCKGNSLKKLGRNEEAEQCFDKAEELEKLEETDTTCMKLGEVKVTL